MEIKVPKTCEVACLVKMKKSDKDAFVRAIDDDYRVHWSVDNLPVGTMIIFLFQYFFIKLISKQEEEEEEDIRICYCKIIKMMRFQTLTIIRRILSIAFLIFILI